MNIRLYEDGGGTAVFDRDRVQFERKGWKKETYQSIRPSRRKCEPPSLLLPSTPYLTTMLELLHKLDAA